MQRMAGRLKDLGLARQHGYSGLAEGCGGANEEEDEECDFHER